MRKDVLTVLAAGAMALAGCATSEPALPSLPGALPGSVAADRDGDGIVDGYYTLDGAYHPMYGPPPSHGKTSGQAR